MKKYFFVFLLAIPAFSFAQDKSQPDTVITKDPLNPQREYWAIHNALGMVTSQGFMLNGKKDGVWREYEMGNGKLTKIEEYTNGVINGASIHVHINGSITSDETFLNDKMNGQQGHMNNYGQVKMIENYKDGILNGLKKMFYDNATVQEEGYYLNGQRTGLTKWYKGDGKPSIEHTYVNGIIQGPAREFDDNGKIKRMGKYENDNETGEWQEFQDSVLVKKIIYKDGKIVKEIPVKK